MDASQDDPLDRSPDATKWNPGFFNAAGHSRITLRFIQATVCEARAPGMPFLLVTFLWACKDKFIGNEFVLRMQTRQI